MVITLPIRKHDLHAHAKMTENTITKYIQSEDTQALPQHYENTPIQIYRKIYLQKHKIFR